MLVLLYCRVLITQGKEGVDFMTDQAMHGWRVDESIMFLVLVGRGGGLFVESVECTGSVLNMQRIFYHTVNVYMMSCMYDI